MKAIGGTRWRVALIYLGQAMVLGAVALLVALPVEFIGGRALCRVFAALLNFDTSFAVPLWVYFLVLSVAIMVPLLAAAYPIWKGTAISVKEALADFGT